VLFGLGALVWVVGRTFVSGVEVPGFAFLASIVVIFSGAQLVSLGIIGEYLSRMHFRTMRKPSYVVAEETAPARQGRAAASPRAATRPTGRRPKPTP
jgi:undecaprenyl-phosphate 4-deoxy-4-formamido-L-arabinose transferase